MIIFSSIVNNQNHLFFCVIKNEFISIKLYFNHFLLINQYIVCGFLNDEELQAIQKMLGLPDEERVAVSSLITTYNLKLAVITRGKNGSLFLTPTEISKHSGFPSQVVDTIGAGDDFMAATTLGYLLEQDLDTINEHANRLAAYVCTQKGAMPAIPAKFELR